MKKYALVFILAQFAATAINAAVDLTPRYLEIVSDGLVEHRLYFSDGVKKIGVVLDNETEVVAENGGVDFLFTNYPGSSLSIRQSAFDPKLPFAEKSLEPYRAAALALVPSGVKDPKIEEEVLDPVPVNNWHSYRFVIAYYTGTVAAKRSVTFLNISDRQQLVLLTSATEKNFPLAATRSHLIICSWHELRDAEQKPSTGN